MKIAHSVGTEATKVRLGVSPANPSVGARNLFRFNARGSNDAILLERRVHAQVKADSSPRSVRMERLCAPSASPWQRVRLPSRGTHSQRTRLDRASATSPGGTVAPTRNLHVRAPLPHNQAKSRLIRVNQAKKITEPWARPDPKPETRNQKQLWHQEVTGGNRSKNSK